MTKHEFFPLFTLLCETYNREATKSLSMAYYMVLDGLTVDEFQKAVKSILASRKYSTMPLPADLLEAVHGSTEDKALIALAELESAIGRHGTHKSVCFQDRHIMAAVQAIGGWVSIGTMEQKEWEFKRKEFLKVYQASLRSPGGFDAPRYLVGVAEQQNRFNGHEEYADQEHIQLIGNFEIDGNAVKSIASGSFGKYAPALIGESERQKNNAIELAASVVKRIGE